MSGSGRLAQGKYMPRQYQKAVFWIALNDEPLWSEEQKEDIARMLTCCMVADLYRLAPVDVAADVIAIRKSEAFKRHLTRQ